MKPIAMLTRNYLARVIAHELEIPLNEAKSLVEALIASMTCALQRGEEIEIRGFGSWRIRTRGARTSRNPRTGTPVQVPAKKIVKFRPARELFSGVLATDLHRMNVQPDASPSGFRESLDHDGEHNDVSNDLKDQKACCGPFVSQSARLRTLTSRIAALRDSGADPLTIEFALKQKLKVEGWLAQHSHGSHEEARS